jgi:type II secretory pathway component GspD/PulD (secretin)
MQRSQRSRVAGIASGANGILLFWCLCLGIIIIRVGNGQESTSSASAEAKLQPEARPLSSELSDASFTRTFQVYPNSLVELIPVIGARLEEPREAIRCFLISRGVELSDTFGLFYNDRTGVLTARGNLLDLDAIETALATRSITPPQVRLQTLVVELSAEALTGNLKEVLGMPEDELSVTDTNIAARRGFSILTEPQVRVLIRALEQRQGVDLWTGPTVTTLSGRQARLSIEQPGLYPITDPPFSAPGKPMKSQ